MSKLLTKEELLNRFKKIHGDEYDYSLFLSDNFSYKSVKGKMPIICRKHGVFYQKIRHHLEGCKCPECQKELRAIKHRLTKDEILKRINETKNKDYDYSLFLNNNFSYQFITDKIPVICHNKDENGIEHGVFYSSITSLMHPYPKCPKCAEEHKIKKLQKNKVVRQLDKDLLISEFRKIHGDRYSYDKIFEKDYIIKSKNQKIPIICSKHGVFYQRIDKHLSGQGCPKCARNLPITKEEFIERARKIHGDKYDYSKVDYVNGDTKVCIICPEHGEFWQKPNYHMKGRGCPLCASNIPLTTNEFIKRAKEVHGDKYDYSKVEYVNYGTKVCIVCPKHGEFWQLTGNHIGKKQGCPRCEHHVSAWEEEIANYLKSLNLNIIQSDRKILDGKEIDILLPDYSIGIECDGLNFHSEKYKDKNYHLLKTEECAKKGIRLIHIFEDEWVNKKNIIESMLSNIFRKSKVKIYARKCEIKDVPTKDKTKFLDENHIQGRSNSTVNFGLYYNNELVSLMTFGKPRINMGGDKSEGSWELVRFCNKLNTNVIGGASKLFTKFAKDYNPKKIITYSDKRWATGNMYQILGFINTHDSDPNYFYIIDDERKNRFNFRKSVLIKEGYDPNKTEHEIMLDRDIYRIYDCGCKVWEWKSDV